jgi:DNA-binding NarL/FixJ family response regulator
MVRVALLDDHPAVLAGLRRLIDPEPDLAVVAAADSAPELARQLDGMHADVLVIDDDRAHGDGLSYCQRIKDRPNAPGVLIYAAHAGPALILSARAAQADAVIDKAMPVAGLLAAIRAVADGDALLPVVTRDAYEMAISRLDAEDLPILAMLFERESIDTIAHALKIDRREIAWRTRRIVGRLRPKLAAPNEQRVHSRRA